MSIQRNKFLLTTTEQKDYITYYNDACHEACNFLDSILKFCSPEEKEGDVREIEITTQKNLKNIVHESLHLMKKMKKRISEFPEETEEEKAEKEQCVVYFNRILTSLNATLEDPGSEEKRAFLFYLLNWPAQQKFRGNSYYHGIAIICLCATFALCFCSIVFQIAFLPILANAGGGMVCFPILSLVPSILAAYQRDKYNSMYLKSLISSSIPEKMENPSTIDVIKKINLNNNNSIFSSKGSVR
ncbi:MAG: hypothetical protein K0R24_2027 [Gammaproteobacteria bacterium]|jgi:hypothetical protein|nr:hypothetical protein [Gammaproteobacteria bacterium]